jgi:DegV family protein with EDD domain
VGVFAEAYRVAAQGADAIVSIHISAKLSRTYNSALLGAEEAGLIVPVQVLDSRTVSLALGLIVVAAARAAQSGANREEVVRIAEAATERTHLLFMLDTLEYLQRGGRIGKARAFLGTLIQVKPLLTLREGEIHPARQVRTRARAVDALVEWAQGQKAEAMGVVYSTLEADAQALAARLTPPKELIMSQIGPVLGVHAGPGALGVAVRVGG